MSKVEALISDADGTLVDTVRLIRHGQYEAARIHFAKRGIEHELPVYNDFEQVLNRVVGGSALDTMTRTMQTLYSDKPSILQQLDLEELHALLNPAQDKLAPEYVKAFDGLSDFLRRLGESAIKLGIFSSGRPHHLVRNFGLALPELGIKDLYLDSTIQEDKKLLVLTDALRSVFKLSDCTIISCYHTSKHKPDPESLLLAMSHLDVPPNECAVMGDHTVDMQAAIRAGVEYRLGVTHGFEDETVLRKAGATHIAHSLSEAADTLLTQAA